MKKSAASMIIILSVSMLCACVANKDKAADIALSAEIAVDQSAKSASGAGGDPSAPGSVLPGNDRCGHGHHAGSCIG